MAKQKKPVKVPAPAKAKPPLVRPTLPGRAWLMAADPKAKRPRGRPQIIATPEEFLTRMDSYLAVCGEIEEPITITGMALALGFVSRQSLFEYGKDPRFALHVKLARAIVEHDYELQARRQGSAGSIFGLKNFGWIDEHTMRVTGEDGGPVRFADMTDAQLRERGTQLANRLAALTAVHAAAAPAAVTPPGPSGGNGSKPGTNGHGKP